MGVAKTLQYSLANTSKKEQVATHAEAATVPLVTGAAAGAAAVGQVRAVASRDPRVRRREGRASMSNAARLLVDVPKHFW